MQQKLTILNTFLALASIALAALATIIWIEPKHPSKVDPRTINPAPREMEEAKVTRPYLSRADVNPIATANLFRKERTEYKKPPPPPPPSTPAVAPPRIQKPKVPPPNVSLKGTFIAAGTRIAFLEGKYSVLGAGNKMQEKKIKRKGYYLGDSLGGFKIKKIEKTRVSLSNDSQGSSMTLRLAKRTPADQIQRKGSHLFHKNKKGRGTSKIDVEKVKRAPSSPRVVSPNNRRGSNRPRISPSPASSRRVRSSQNRNIQVPPNVKLPPNLKLPPNVTLSPSQSRQITPPTTITPPRITPPRISGAITPPAAPKSTPHISGVAR